MTHRLILLLLSFVMSSCATVFLKRHYNLDISTNAPNATAQIGDSIYKLPVNLEVKRSRNDLKFKLFSDNLTRNYVVKSSPNPVFAYGNLLWLRFSPAAYLIDFTNQKRFYYGNSVFLDIHDSVGIIRPPVSKFYHDYFLKSYQTNKGQINLLLSLPWINNFYLKPCNESAKLSIGFYWISGGIEYFYKNDKYIGLTANAVMDNLAPFPAPIDYNGAYETMSSVYLNLTDNFKFKRFTFGYGLNYSINNWELKHSGYHFDPSQPTRDPARKSSQSIGFTVNEYYQLGRHFFIGLIYRPSFIDIYPKTELKYEHLISLDFSWKFRLKK